MVQTLDRSQQNIKVTSGSINEFESDFAHDRASNLVPQLSEVDTQRILKNNQQIGVGSSHRTALLGILLAELGDIPFDEIALLLDVKPGRLLKLIHGEEQLQSKFEERGAMLVEIARNLHQILEDGATSRWLNTAIPRLAGRTPLDAIYRGGLPQVLSLTRAYLDQSFA